MSESQKPLSALRLIVGLGNPGRDYQDTRHNVGFMIVDALASQLQAAWTTEKRWDCAVAKFSRGWLMKPLTYMNASGRAAHGLAQFYKIAPAEVLAVYDDVDLPFGTLRFKPKGSAAGHNGLKSMIQHFGGDDFPRLKVGIASPSGRPAGDRMIGHVLGKFSPDEQAGLPTTISRATQAIRTALDSGLDAAMLLFNRKENSPES